MRPHKCKIQIVHYTQYNKSDNYDIKTKIRPKNLLVIEMVVVMILVVVIMSMRMIVTVFVTG